MPRHRQTVDFFVFCSGKNLLGNVSWFLLFCFTSSLSGTQSKYPKVLLSLSSEEKVQFFMHREQDSITHSGILVAFSQFTKF